MSVATIEEMLADPGLATDPHPLYERLLDERVWQAPVGEKVFSRFEDCSAIMRDPTRFGQYFSQHKKPSFGAMNPPEHTRLRMLVARAFTPRAVDRLESQIDGIATDLLAGMLGRGSMDMVTEFAQPIAAHMITLMIGIPLADRARWEVWANAIHEAIGTIFLLPSQQQHAGEMMAAARAASEQEADYFAEVIAARRAAPRRDDLLATMMDAEEDGEHLTDEELRYSLVLLLGAGHHTTVNLMSQTVLYLLRNPDQLAMVRADRDLIPNAIDETARSQGVQQFLPRVVREDTEVAGVSLRAGEVIRLCLGAANRDPSVFPDPSRFDVTRANVGRHLAFGFGVHFCLGRALAMAESRVAVGHLLDLPALRLAPFQYEGMTVLRGPLHLPLLW